MLKTRPHSAYLLETIRMSREVALDMGYQYIDSISFVLAAVRQEKNGVAVALREKEIDLAVLEKLFKQGPAYNTTVGLPLTKDFEEALMGASRFAELYQSQSTEVEHVLISIMQKYNFSTMLLLNAGFDMFVLETSLLKHGVLNHPILFTPKQTAWQKVKNWLVNRTT